MFGILSNLTKAVVNVVTLPVDVAADAITLFGALTDQDKPYTAQKVETVFKNLRDAGK